MKTLKCKRCKHEWTPRTDNPTLCPHCKSYKWNEMKMEHMKRNSYEMKEGKERNENGQT